MKPRQETISITIPDQALFDSESTIAGASDSGTQITFDQLLRRKAALTTLDERKSTGDSGSVADTASTFEQIWRNEQAYGAVVEGEQPIKVDAFGGIAWGSQACIFVGRWGKRTRPRFRGSTSTLRPFIFWLFPYRTGWASYSVGG